MPFSSEQAPMRAPNPFMYRRAAKAENVNPETRPRITARFTEPQNTPVKSAGRYDPLETVVKQPADPATDMPVTTNPQPEKPAQAQMPASAPAPAVTPVERFRQINKTLPDGVLYEPLDKETLKKLQETAGMAQSRHSPAPQAHSGEQSTAMMRQAPSSFTVSKRNEMIEQFIQDERNAHVFYKNLAENAPGAEMETTIAGISRSSAERMGIFKDMYKRLHRQDFTPEEVEINTEISFADGIKLAMFEENKSILALTAWLDKKPDGETAREIQNAINKKMVNYNLLSLVSALV